MPHMPQTIKELKETINDLVRVNEDAAEEIKVIKEALHNGVMRENSFSKKVEDLENHVKILKMDIHDNDATIKHFQIEIDVKNKEIERYRIEITKANTLYDAEYKEKVFIRDSHQLALKEIAEAKISIQMLNEELGKIGWQLEQEKGKLKATDASYNLLNNTANEYEKKIVELQELVHSQHEENIRLTENLVKAKDDLKQDVKFSVNKVDELQKLVNYLNTIINDKNAEVNKLNAELEAEKHKIASKNALINKLNAELELEKSKVKSIDGAYAVSIASRQELQKKLSEFTKPNFNLVNKITGLEKDNDYLTKEMIKVNGKFNDSQDALENLKKENNEFREQKNFVLDQANKKQEMLDKIAAENIELKNQKTELILMIEQLRREVKELKGKTPVTPYSTTMRDHEKEVQELKDTIEEVRKHRENVINLLIVRDATISNLEKEKANLDNKIIGVKNELYYTTVDLNATRLRETIQQKMIEKITIERDQCKQISDKNSEAINVLSEFKSLMNRI